MPEPKPGEEQDAFVSRCIKYVMDNEDITDNKHAAAKCYGIWRQAHKKSESVNFGAQGRIDEIIGKYMDESGAVIAQVQKKIDEYKKKLSKLSVRENFGDRQIRDLKDSFDIYRLNPQDRKTVTDMMHEFEDWCMNYTGK
jgi:hypothetical protein